MSTAKNRYPVGSVVRCYRSDETGRVGVVREVRPGTGVWNYKVEWTDGKTPSWAPATTWVRATNVTGMA